MLMEQQKLQLIYEKYEFKYSKNLTKIKLTIRFIIGPESKFSYFSVQIHIILKILNKLDDISLI